jgi:hypothetical protein
MRVGELIERLQQFDEDAEVRLAFQPSWPLQFEIKGVASLREAERQEPEEDQTEEREDDIIYIVEGSHPHKDSPYANRNLWDVA